MANKELLVLDNRKVLKSLKGTPMIVLQSLVSGTNKTAKQGRNAASRGITKVYTIPAKRLKQGLKVTNRATRADLRAIISATGRTPGLQTFRARQTRKGVSVMVTKGNRKTITGGFLAPGAGGKGVGLFVGSGTKRVPKRGSYKGRRMKRGANAGRKLTREFLERRPGPSIPAMFKRRGRVKARRFIRENYARIVTSEFNFRMRRALGQR